MASVRAVGVSLDIPLLGRDGLSFRKTLLRRGTSGRISAAANVVVVHALRDLSFTLSDGDRVGVIGLNGSGKTTLLRLVAGIYHSSAGSLTIEGSVLPLLSPGIATNYEASGWDNIRIGCLYLGLPPREIEKKVQAIGDFTELNEYLALPVHTYSAGMMIRLVFAISTALMPEILVLDEVINVGDVVFAKKANERFKEVIDQSRILMIASHSEGWIKDSCNKGILLHQGRLMAVGPVDEVFREYQAISAQADAQA